MTFNMRRAHNVVTDSIKVPTLREALLCCKDRILVNVDHAYPYYKEIVELANELGVTMKEVYDFIRNNKEAKKDCNDLLNSGMDFDEASVLAYMNWR